MTHRFARAAARRVADVRAHPVVSAVLLALAARIATTAADTTKAVVYLAACASCVVLADALAPSAPDGRRGETTAAEPRLRVVRPGPEFVVLAWMALVATLATLVRAGAFDGALPPLVRAAVLLAGIACLFQVVPVLWLMVRGYRTRDLGGRWTGAAAGLACVAVVAAAAVAVDPDGAPVVRAARLGAWGEFALLVTALPQVFAEEFLRMTFQTRIAALTRNAALGWLLAAIPWAFLHAPMWVANGDTVAGAVGGSLRIVPIGLVWGFLTWRTGSLVPAVIAHALNLWGLQNP
ncbi:MAG: hypothetical protein HMLKMBBP_03251 [Planctomycetes bacterium]|nr:hypothetical protein [Planctomycetota bacterium]